MAVAKGQLVTPEQFGDIVIREQQDGGTVRIRDVARVELGSQVYTTKARLNGQPSAIIALYQLPGTNALAAADGVKKLMADVESAFSAGIGVRHSAGYHPAGDRRDSGNGQDAGRSVGVGDSGGLPVPAKLARDADTALGCPGIVGWHLYSVSASWFLDQHAFAFRVGSGDRIGRRRCDRGGGSGGTPSPGGLAAEGGTLKAMKEITGPVIGVALVLASVFVPTAFIPGITGRLYQQFAVTIAVSVMPFGLQRADVESGALCACCCAGARKQKDWSGKFFAWFNRLFGRATETYVRISKKFIRRSGITLILLLLFGLLAFAFGKKIPTSFLPDEDQGFFYVNLQLPNAASLQRTDAVCRKIESILSQTAGVRYTTTVAGFSLLSGVQSAYSGFFFVTLNPWEERKKLAENYQVLKGKLNLNLIQLPEGTAFAFSPPAIPGLGVAGGVTFVLEDRADRGVQYLANNVDTFLAAARERRELARVTTTLLPNVPQVYIEVDRDKALKQGVAFKDIYNTLQTFLGGSFVNYFNRFGRQWQVYVQADDAFRTNAEQIGQFYVRNATMTRCRSLL